MASILDSSQDDPKKPDAIQGATLEASGTGRLRVKIAAPYNIYYDAEAESVSAENQTGPFDILKGHHNFMSLLTAGEIVVKNAKGDQAFKISRGIMHVHSDTVKIFLDV
jgi:F0F1-type ATP synthase epsilon subunit